MEEKKLISVKNIVDGFKSLIKVKDALGENSTFWLGLIDGINKKMNMDFLDAFENHKEVLYTEVIIQYLMKGDVGQSTIYTFQILPLQITKKCDKPWFRIRLFAFIILEGSNGQ